MDDFRETMKEIVDLKNGVGWPDNRKFQDQPNENDKSKKQSLDKKFQKMDAPQHQYSNTYASSMQILS